MSEEGKTVCVTGASGYVASWLVKLLLDRGYTVHASVRSLCDPSKTKHLLALDGAKERLSLYEANLSVQGSFDAAVNDCLCVFHMASPVLALVNDPSSDVIDETWFSDPDICEQRKMWYSLSKTLAEDDAVNFAKDNGLDLVVINPGYVIGPILQPTLNLTSDGILSILKDGKDLFPGGMYLLVDVRDVAKAHILAFENPGTNGRYCMVGKAAPHMEIMKIVDKLYPSLGHSERRKDGECVEPLPYYVSRAKAESLGVKFTPLEVSIKDTVESLKETNLLSF
ncbi:phenylacetaldehyde reductase-like [Bidens hawaiensis]|uniref:phenylacetaldehyde reductase-like n=1 Tax=Bidens hawaiensis TaxID=980011 RepID=UPI0040496A51